MWTRGRITGHGQTQGKAGGRKTSLWNTIEKAHKKIQGHTCLLHSRMSQGWYHELSYLRSYLEESLCSTLIAVVLTVRRVLSRGSGLERSHYRSALQTVCSSPGTAISRVTGITGGIVQHTTLFNQLITITSASNGIAEVT